MMIVGGTFLYFLICGCALTSAALYGTETYGGEEWWTSKNFVKFYSPSGKNYFIDYGKGELSLESLDSMQDSANKEVTSPYISFVSLDLKVYDIFFEQNDHYTPRIVQKQVNFNDKSTFIRHSLHSFVGPNKQIYTIVYNNNSSITIESEKPSEEQSLQIKTLGPYAKWEHTYTFSQNGDIATDLTLSPVQITTDRSIQLAEMEADLLRNNNVLLAHFNTLSGERYLVTDKLDIALDQDKLKITDQPYVTFIEPNGKSYDIFFQNDGSENVAKVVPSSNNTNEDKNHFGQLTTQLLSFIGPDQKSYRIDRTNQEVPVLDISSTSSDFRVTFIQTHKYYKNYVSFIFSSDGMELHDRVDELDSTPLAALPALSIDEVEIDGDIAKSSLLTFYSPSGRIYYLTPVDHEAKYAVAKGIHNVTDSLYISFGIQDGRTSNIYFKSDGATDMKFGSVDRASFSSVVKLQSFVTPNKKLHKVKYDVENDIRIPYLDTTDQPIDPLDENQVDCLKIIIASTSRVYSYLFNWNADKLIDAYSQPQRRVSSNVLKSLVG